MLHFICCSFFILCVVSLFHFTSSASDNGIIRTLKAEKRQHLHTGTGDGVHSPMVDKENILTTDPREIEAEKRAAWRKARCVGNESFV